MPTRPLLSVLAMVVCLVGTAAFRPDRRVVDVAEAGNTRSEASHGYAGHETTAGETNGGAWRQTRGWMHYALTTFEDTEVTVACTFVALDTLPHDYDLVVEDSVIASRTFRARDDATAIVEFLVPFALTKGKPAITVVLRARGGVTPALRALRTIQDHYEVDHLQNPSGAAR